MNRILLITHNRVGEALLATVKHTLGGQLPCPVDAINVHQNEVDTDFLCHELRTFLNAHTEDILILTDMFGATPCNIARQLMVDNNHVRVISGLNLPMLMKALNYADKPLLEMTDKAFAGGREGVCACTPPSDKTS